MYDKIELWEDGEFEYRDNGIGFMIRFVGSNGPKTQMRILPGKDSPLTGPRLLYRSTKVVNASNNLYYDVVPFEWLRTFHVKPQVLVHVDGIIAVCPNMNCDFMYTEPHGEVQEFEFYETDRVLLLKGIDLP